MASSEEGQKGRLACQENMGACLGLLDGKMSLGVGGLERVEGIGGWLGATEDQDPVGQSAQTGGGKDPLLLISTALWQ